MKISMIATELTLNGVSARRAENNATIVWTIGTISSYTYKKDEDRWFEFSPVVRKYIEHVPDPQYPDNIAAIEARYQLVISSDVFEN